MNKPHADEGALQLQSLQHRKPENVLLIMRIIVGGDIQKIALVAETVSVPCKVSVIQYSISAMALIAVVLLVPLIRKGDHLLTFNGDK
jgi:type IV secretory pathway component VirB8